MPAGPPPAMQHCTASRSGCSTMGVGGCEVAGDIIGDAVLEAGQWRGVACRAKPRHVGLREILIVAGNCSGWIDVFDAGLAVARAEDRKRQVLERASLARAEVVDPVDR